MRDNRLNRQPSGRGRSSKRTRTPLAGSSTRSSGKGPTPQAEPAASATSPGRTLRALRRPALRLTFTRRALVLFGIVALLAASFASSLRVWVVQSQDLALARTQIEQRTARVAELEDELARWEDPAFVRAQARQRLGWVMPGEVGYRVIGADGEVLSGTADIEGVGEAETSQLATRWWDRVAGSLRRADEPDPQPR